MVKNVLKESPMANLNTRKEMYSGAKGVATPVMRAMMLEAMMAGILPWASANQPKTIMPGMAPQKKRDWERAGTQARSHTQSCSTVTETWWPSMLYSHPAWHGTTCQAAEGRTVCPASTCCSTRAQSVLYCWHWLYPPNGRFQKFSK